MLQSWMSPRNSVLKLHIKECVADTKTIITAKLQQVAIFVHLSNAKTAQTSGPRIVISTNSSVKVFENEQWLSLRDFLIVAARSLQNLSFTSVVDDNVGAYALMRVTGPADEWSCRDRILSLPTVGGTMDLSRLFLTSKPSLRLFVVLLYIFYLTV